ncbi:MAG: glycosyltransferase [Lentisphaeria bacterium]|nr:glycosyltransferase [Lentisphaeria bacterium]
MKKVALIHYWLTNMRGGENVTAEFCKLFPDADVFTHAWNPDKVKEPFNTHKITESFIAHLPLAREKCQIYLPLMPAALSKLDFSPYDLILSNESGPSKGIRKPAGARHVCYCNTPMRYVWDMFDDYYRAAGIGGKIAMRIFKNYMRRYDLKSAENVDQFLANSNFVAERIKRIYGRDSIVVYPPVDTDYFVPENTDEPKDYYLAAGQLISYKRPELALRACMKMRRKLVLVGVGPMVEQLKKEAAGNPDIIFAGRATRPQLRKYYAEAKGLIFPGIEDFGIVPLESQSVGVPVIALGIGGALETVSAGKTGVFFPEPTVESLCHAIEEFESMRFDKTAIMNHARNFHRDVFVKKMRHVLGMN